MIVRPFLFVVNVSGMSCASCVASLETALGRMLGVVHVSVNLATERTTITYDADVTSVQALAQAIEDVGYQVRTETVTLPIYESLSRLSCKCLQKLVNMEDVLEVYTRPYDAQRPHVCVDETSKQLVADTRVPIPAAAGQPARVDYEYERQGTANLLMVFEPLAGRRRVKVTARRTAVDFAQLLREVSDEQYPQAEKIVLVMDNLNTYKPASLYGAFEPAEARRLLERLEIHDTPKHGSWLNMAETELSVLATHCVDRRIPDPTILAQEVTAWEQLALLKDISRLSNPRFGVDRTLGMIADRLCISEATVRHHLTSIYAKRSVGDRLELAIYAYRHGLVSFLPHRSKN